MSEATNNETKLVMWLQNNLCSKLIDRLLANWRTHHAVSKRVATCNLISNSHRLKQHPTSLLIRLGTQHNAMGMALGSKSRVMSEACGYAATGCKLWLDSGLMPSLWC
eukprot:6192365-Pleurochrysis_carterae.AAC.3